LLSPFKKIIDENTILLNRPKKIFACGIKLFGINIALLNLNEQLSKIEELNNLLKGISASFTFIKLEESINFETTNAYYEELKNSLNNDSQQNQNRILQLEGMLNVNKEIEGYHEFKQQTFYLLFYGENLSLLKNEVGFFQESMFRTGLRADNLKVKDILNIFHLLTDEQMIGSIDFNSSLEQLMQIDLTKVYKVNYLKEEKKNLQLKNGTFQAIYGIYDYPFEVGLGWLVAIAMLENTSFV
jgi:hypothetical protein